MKRSIEWAPFCLKIGVDVPQLLLAADAMHESFICKQAAYLNRKLLFNADGVYVDLIEWVDDHGAKQAFKAAGSDDNCNRYFALMDQVPNGALASVQHFSVIKIFPEVNR